MKNLRFTNSRIITPIANFIDDGHLFQRPFSWLYRLIAIVNLIGIPVLLVTNAANGELLEYEMNYILTYGLLFICFSSLAFVSFQLWWNRSNKVREQSNVGDSFVAIPVVTHLFQTIGEYVGIWIGIGGFLSQLIIAIILAEEAFMFQLSFGIRNFGDSWAMAFVFPLLGFLIIVLTRFIAEQFRATAAIANNTRNFRSLPEIKPFENPQPEIQEVREETEPKPKPDKGSDWGRYTPPQS